LSSIDWSSASFPVASVGAISFLFDSKLAVVVELSLDPLTKVVTVIIDYLSIFTWIFAAAINASNDGIASITVPSSRRMTCERYRKGIRLFECDANVIRFDHIIRFVILAIKCQFETFGIMSTDCFDDARSCFVFTVGIFGQQIVRITTTTIALKNSENCSYNCRYQKSSE
jgi:hypothetical protein